MKKIITLYGLLLIVFAAPAQNVGIGTTNPQARLQVIDSSVVFSATGLASLPSGNPPISGPGKRMMWYADKAAFRTGYVQNTEWDNDNVGPYSFAAGFNTKAIGTTSFAFGNQTSALANYSTAMGIGSIASGEYSTATGFYATASGIASTAIGYSNARGVLSASMGEGTIAKGYASLVLGMYNDSILTTDQTGATATTPLFIIGNGSSPANRWNAMTVLKNGNVGINTTNPATLLHIRQGSAGGVTPNGYLADVSAAG